MPSGVTYDLSHLTMLPGLIDVHDHIVWYFNAAGKLHTGRSRNDQCATDLRACNATPTAIRPPKMAATSARMPALLIFRRYNEGKTRKNHAKNQT